MSPVVVATISFGCILGAALAGIAVGPKLPGHHLESNSKDVVRLSMGMIATMTALVLGLVTGSAKSAFDAEDSAIKGTAKSCRRAGSSSAAPKIRFRRCSSW
jgi:hypothetical protein